MTNRYWDPSLSKDSFVGGNGSWSASTTSWMFPNETHGPWADGDLAVFSGAAGTVTVDGTFVFSNIVFNTYGYSLTGSSAVLVPLDGSAVIRGPLGAAGDTITFDLTFGGSHGLSFQRGTFALGGSQTYTGTTRIDSGSLILQSNMSSTEDMTFVVGTAGRLDVLTNALYSKVLTVDNSGAVHFGPNSFIQKAVIDNKGSLFFEGKVGTSANLKIENSTEATIDLSGVAKTSDMRIGKLVGGGQLVMSQWHVTVGEAVAVDDTMAFDGDIMTKAGNQDRDARLYFDALGKVVLSGESNYGGSIIVSKGTLVVDGATSTGKGTMQINEIASVTMQKSGWENQSFTNLGKLTFAAGTSTLNVSQVDNQGVLSIESNVSPTQTVDFSKLSIQSFDGAISRLDAGTGKGLIGGLRGTGNVDLVSGRWTLSDVDGSNGEISGVISGDGALRKTSESMLTLSGANTFTGGLTLAGATVILANDSAAGTGTLQFEADTANVLVVDAVSLAVTIAGMDADDVIDLQQFNMFEGAPDILIDGSQVTVSNDTQSIILHFSLPFDSATTLFASIDSDESTLLKFAVQPAAPTLLALADTTNTGNPDDTITGVKALTITGMSSVTGTITIYDDVSGAVGSQAVTAGQPWQLVTSVLDDGVHSLTATITDANGLVSTASSALQVTVDTTAPDVLSLTLDNMPMRAGDSKTVSITMAENSGALTMVSGKVAGYTLTGFVATSTADVYQASFVVTAGGHEFAAMQDLPVSLVLRDLAGNETTFNTPIHQNGDAIDMTAPTAAVQALVVNDVDRNGAYSGGDTVLLQFSEPVQRAGINADTIFLDGKSLTELGATVLPVPIASGPADSAQSFVITLGTASVAPGVVLSIAAGMIVDHAGNLATAGLSVTVPAMPTSPVATAPTTPVDGVPVEVSTGTDGQQQIKIPVVTDNRDEDTSTPNSKLADIALVKTVAGTPLLNLGVPVGTGATAKGPATPVSGSAAQNVLDGGLTAAAGTSEQKAAAQGFVSSLEPGTQVVVQTVTVTAQAANGGPLVINAGNLQDGHKTALIIDTRALPAGTLIDLENVDFAIIVGDARVTGGAGANVVYGDDLNQFIVLGEGDDILHGQGGTDTVGSLRGNDQTFGDDGNDVVYGGTGDDVLHGGNGTDRMNGGFGFDTGVQAGVLADYTVTLDGHAVVLTHKANGEVDRFLDVEHISFDSGTSIIVAHEAGDVATLTAQFTDAQLIELNADRAVPGTAGNDDVTPELGVALNIDLGAGTDIVRLAGGRTDVHIDVEAGQRAELTRLEDGAMLAFNNVEMLAFANGDVTVLAHKHEEAVIGRAYELLLGRNVDTDGYAFWIAGIENGAQLHGTLDLMMQSPEYSGAALSNAAFVEQLYTNGFDRTADAEGKAFWVGALDAGASRAQVLEGFAASGEASIVIVSTIDVTTVS